MKRKIIDCIIFMFILFIIFNCSLAYSNLSYSIDIPSDYYKVGDNSFSNSNGYNINIQVVYFSGSTPENYYTEERLDEIVNDMTNNVNNYKEEIRKKLREKNQTNGNVLTEEEINQYADSYRMESVVKKEITFFSKNNYKCFHVITKYQIEETPIYSNQYIVLSGNYIYTLTISAKDLGEFDSSELVSTINSFTIKEDKKTYDAFPLYWTLLLDFIITVAAYELIPFILKVIKRKEYSKKNAAIITIVNSFVVKVIILCCQFFVIENDNNNAIFDSMPAFFYGIINYYWLKSKIKNKDDKEKNKKTNTKNKKIIRKNEEVSNSNLKKNEPVKTDVLMENKHDTNTIDILDVQPIEDLEDFEKITVSNKSNYCNNCGKKVKEDWDFCNYCGNKIK